MREYVFETVCDVEKTHKNLESLDFEVIGVHCDTAIKETRIFLDDKETKKPSINMLIQPETE